MNIASDVTKLIGNTPMVWLKTPRELAKIVAKLEYFNPLSSVKDRVAVNMIDRALARGDINPATEIVEPTSGNTGIGLAFVAAARGLKLTIFMPDSFSPERRAIMKALGAKLVLTPGKDGMPGAISAAEDYCKVAENSFMPQQFKNPDNPDIHRWTTGPEIWRDTDGKVDIFVAGVGTGGTLTGVGRFLKSRNPKIKVVAVEPEASAVLSGGEKGPHTIQGMGAGFVPEVLERDLIDEVVKVGDEEARQTTATLAKKQGIFVGGSAGAAAFAAMKIASRKENKDKLIVTIFPDAGDRYISGA